MINFWVTFLQVTLLLALFVLEYLSGYKAGLAQHLYFKKVYYISHYYQGVPLILHFVLLVLLTMVAVKMYVRNSHQTRIKLRKYFIILVGLVSWFFAGFTHELNVYAHVLMIVEFCLLLEIVSLTLRFYEPNN
ncbi:hypothetical protein LA52FAK_07570 [Desulforhopalus sp. 52FAK]